jgi:hypothetical protein
VLCEVDDKGRVISCQMLPCWSVKAEWSGKRRKDVDVSRVVILKGGRSGVDGGSKEEAEVAWDGVRR